jgi:hypothetical protein
MTVQTAYRSVKHSIVDTLKATWIDHETGAFSVPHFASVVAIAALTMVFVKNAYLGKVDGLDYIYYSVAMAASASPSLMHKFIARGETQKTEEKKS